MKKIYFFLMLVFFIIACRSSWTKLPASLETPTALISDPSHDAIEKSQGDNGTSANAEKVSCEYTWTIQSLPETTRQVQEAFNQAGLSYMKVIAEAYRENCIDTLTNTVTGYKVMETDFRISLRVQSVQDENELGNALSRILATLLALPLDTFPGVRTGFVEVLFIENAGTKRVKFALDDGKTAMDQHLDGQTLFKKLNPDD